MLKKIIKKVTIIMCAILSVMTFIPTQAFAATSDSGTVTARKKVVFDSEHWIEIEAVSDVDYAYDEGNSGWIEECIMDININGERIKVDDITLIDCGEFYEPRYDMMYEFYGFEFWSDYYCYFTVYVHCDEWGELSSWITCDATEVYNG